MVDRVTTEPTATQPVAVRGQGPNPPPIARYPNEISFVELLDALLRRLPLVIGAPIVGAFLAGLLAVLSPPTYTAEVSFLPQSQRQQSSGEGLLARLGLGGGGESPNLYVDLLESREIALTVADEMLSFEHDGERYEGTLAELFQVSSGSPERRRRSIQELMKQIIDVESMGSGIVRVTVTTPWPQVSERVAARLLELLAEFNLRRKQTQAGQERQFAQQQMEQARTELRAAEDSLESFLERNRRGYETSPELAMEFARHQRRIEHRQLIYSQLVQAYYNARLDEVRNTPVVTIIEPAEGSAMRDSRFVVRKTLVGGIAGAGIGVLGALLLQSLAGVRTIRVGTGGPEDGLGRMLSRLRALRRHTGAAR